MEKPTPTFGQLKEAFQQRRRVKDAKREVELAGGISRPFMELLPAFDTILEQEINRYRQVFFSKLEKYLPNESSFSQVLETFREGAVIMLRQEVKPLTGFDQPDFSENYIRSSI